MFVFVPHLLEVFRAYMWVYTEGSLLERIGRPEVVSGIKLGWPQTRQALNPCTLSMSCRIRIPFYIDIKYHIMIFHLENSDSSLQNERKKILLI